MATVLSERVEGNVRRIALARPGARNAVDLTICRDLEQAVRAAIADPDARSILLTGEGPHFCAGGNLGFMRNMDANALEAYHASTLDLVRLLAGSPKPTIAAVRGACAGGGVGFALSCDYLLAARSAYFSIQFSRIGLVPDTGVLHFLANRIGRQATRRLLLEDRRVTGEEAARLGICDGLVADDAFEAESLSLARRMAQQPPLAYRQTKWLLDRVDGPLDAFLDNELAAAAPCLGSAEFEEGIAAFLEKRAPRFR